MSKQIGMRGYVIETDTVRWKFGWNQDLLSFFVMKFDKTVSVEDPVIHIGVRPRDIPDGQGLLILARMAGLEIPEETLIRLFQDKDYERRAYFVLHYPGEYSTGFKTDSVRHAELLKEALDPAQPDRELSIRQIIKYDP
jgi:hypothetical protein